MGKPSKSTQLCGIPVEIGMKVFSITELFLVLLHVRVFIGVSSESLAINNDLCPIGFTQFLRGVLCVCLIVQCFAAFLLYFIGHQKRNVTICWIWMGVSATTVIVSMIVCFFVHILITEDHYVCRRRNRDSTIFPGVYELYLIYGIWLVSEYIQWLNNGGTVGELVDDVVATVEPLLDEAVQGSKKQSKTSQATKAAPSHALV